jgi:predicted CoA-substrate-specific enzyme activase
MITAGVDVGAKTIKVLLLDGRRILAHRLVLGGLDTRAALDGVFAEALEAVAGLSRGDLDCVVATGAGRGVVGDADEVVTEVSAAARGASFLVPSARTVIDVGAEEGRAVRCTESGKVDDFAVNEKCAAGAGTFTEAMARALEVSVEELGRLSLRSQKSVPMNAQCTVFAESEVVSLLHAKTPKEDISRAVHDAIASRITSMVRKVGFAKDVVIIGGMAKNPGFVASMRRSLETDVVVPEEPEFVGALGAALIGAERLCEAGGGR